MTKVKRILVQNVKAITDQELNLNGATAIIFGGNDKGKTTLVNALKDRLLKIKPDHLVRTGETDGKYVMEFTTGEIIEWEVTTKTKAGEKLTMVSADGSKTSVITEIINWFEPGDFDIDKFLKSSAAKQQEFVKNLCGLDFTDVDKRYAAAYEARTVANREVERLRAVNKTLDGNIVMLEVEANEKFPGIVFNVVGETPTEEIEKELLAIDTHNRSYDLLSQESTQLEQNLLDCDTEIKRLEGLIDIQKQKKITINDRLDVLDEIMADPANKPKDATYVNTLQERLKMCKFSNQLFNANKDLTAADVAIADASEIAFQKDIAVKDIDKEKQNLIKSANLPEGLGFDDEGITYNGYPLTTEQLSSSSIYIAALKLASMNVGRVKMLHFDASLLDKFKLAEVQDWAEKQGLQLLIERADFEGSNIRYEIIEEDWMK